MGDHGPCTAHLSSPPNILPILRTLCPGTRVDDGGLSRAQIELRLHRATAVDRRTRTGWRSGQFDASPLTNASVRTALVNVCFGRVTALIS